MRAASVLACVTTVLLLPLMSTTCVRAQFGIWVALHMVGRMEK